MRGGMDNFGGHIGVISILILCLMLAIFVTPIALAGIGGYVAYRLYKESPRRAERIAKEETWTLYEHAKAGQVRLSPEEIDAELGQALPSRLPNSLRAQLIEIGRAIFEAEGLTPEVPPPPALCNTIEGARYRDMLAKAGQAGNDRNMSITAIHMISESLAVIARYAPSEDGDVTVPITQFIDKLGVAVGQVIQPYFAENDYNHFKKLRDRLNINFNATHRTTPVWPEDYKGDDVVETYLGGTPLEALFGVSAPFSIPEAIRFEHTHIIGGSGHGKTQTLQFHIAGDLIDVDRGEKSVVVIDSQGDLIQTILGAKTVDPDRIVLIDPEDIAYPVCLNLFSVGQERLAGYDALERERLTNSIIELYDFVLGSLLSAGMTQKQSVVFRYVTRLMFHIPEATIHTLRDLMEPGGAEAYAQHIDKLEGTAKRFFETEFDGKEFEQTKRQVLRRLYGILENQTFERMFSHPQSKLDMFHEMNAGKLILINTSKSLLKENGTEIFGRFFIALIAQAAQERSTLPDWERMPTMVYVDEAQDYFDRTIGVILAQARKYNVGMVLAHQYLGQLDSKLQEAFEANTSIKMAGGVSARDARALASQFNCDPDLIMRQPKGSFATYVRGLTQRAVPISFPFFALEGLAKRSKEELDEIRDLNRELYAAPIKRHDDPGENPEGDDPEEGGAPEPDGPPDDGPDAPAPDKGQKTGNKPSRRTKSATPRSPKVPKPTAKPDTDDKDSPTEEIDADDDITKTKTEW